MFFTSAALSHHLWEIIRTSDYEDLAAESLEGVLIGPLITAPLVALIRLFCRNTELVLKQLSNALLPGLLFVFAPFRYAQLCRWTDWCHYWSDLFLVAGAGLCLLTAMFLWFDSAGRRPSARASAAARRLRTVPLRALFPVALTACLAILIWRGHGRLAHPELFAEGGKQFVANALSHGWHSLTLVYDGYYHTIPRLLSLLATSLAPTALIPAVTVALSFLVAGAAAAFVVRPVFRWLIPSDGARVAAALLLCLVPGLREVLGNLASLHYLLFLVLGLLILKDPAKPYRSWELALSLLIVLSSGMVAALVPAALLRLWLILSDGQDHRLRARVAVHIREVIFTAIIVLPALAMGLIAVGGGITVPVTGEAVAAHPEPARLIQGLSTVFTSMLFLHPLGGSVAVTEIMHLVPQVILAPAGIAVFASMMYAFAAPQRRFQLAMTAAWMSAPLVLVVLIALVRSPELDMFLLDEGWDLYKWWMRYHYLFGAFGILSWLFLVRPTGLLPARARNIVALTLCVAYASQANWYFNIKEYGSERRWLESSAELERAMRTGCPPAVTVRTYPGNWQFTYRTGKTGADCEAAE